MVTGIYKKGVNIAGDRYVDGAVSLPIPIHEAVNRGAKKILVLRTVPTDQNMRSPWAHKLKSWVCPTRTCPKVLDIITGYENAYHDAVDFINRPHKDIQIIEIAPIKKLASRLLGSSMQALNNDYQTGYEMGSLFLDSKAGQLFKHQPA